MLHAETLRGSTAKKAANHRRQDNKKVTWTKKELRVVDLWGLEVI
jgi:hypothetical protein